MASLFELAHSPFALAALAIVFCGCVCAGETRWSWQEAHAKVTPQGDIEWAPKPFVFQKGGSVRYIDFDGGSDDNPGDSKEKPWKHHPWDAAATGNAKAGSGIQTYVFKGGVYYRGEMTVKEAGKPGDPIRLTRDPNWGNGEAVICGSELVKGWKKGADHKDIPEPDKVWFADLDFPVRGVWMVGKEGEIVRIPLARMPNWKVSNPDDVKSEWWVWDMKGPGVKVFGNLFGSRNKGVDSVNIKGKPKELFQGALIWPEYGWVMGGPYPVRVADVDTNEGALGFGSWNSDNGHSNSVMRNMRYYLEDKPHYLDDPNGEFWFDKKGEGGRLYLRPPGDADPNTLRIEAGKRQNLIAGTKFDYIDISGLTFRFTTPIWNFTDMAWDFSTKPFPLRRDKKPGCVQVWGSGKDIRVANCVFEQVCFPISIRAGKVGEDVDGVLIEDNDFRYTDDGILSVADGSAWGYAQPLGQLGDVRILRNHSRETGIRPQRYCSGTGIGLTCPHTAEIAGNVIERSYAQGIDVRGAKYSGCWGDVPLSRVLIHHNKVWQSMLYCNDYGGIETWQGGPFFVYNNLSYDARGLQFYERYTGKAAGFGHAYYLDGAFKNYHFNNIAWGKSREPNNICVNCSAFQEIHSYQNTFFNNTAYNYHTGSRRQAPAAGRNKYLGNVWHGITERVFRHADPAKTAAEGNAKDAGEQKSHFALETNAYANNVFFDITQLGTLEPSGRWLDTLEDFKSALEKNKAILGQLGEQTKTSPLVDPAKGDFRPAPNSAAAGKGAKVFVPWALASVVAEWNFYHAGDDPTNLIDEHWHMADYFIGRDSYHDRPMFPLKAVNVTAEAYVQGPLEDWIAGALSFSPAKKQYAILANSEMMKPFSFQASKVSAHEGGKPEPCTAEGEALKNPQIYKGNFLIEVYFRTAAGHTGGVLMEKMKDSGYSLIVNDAGQLAFSVKGGGNAGTVESRAKVNDGQWHHAVVEADRQARTLTVYLDGKKDASAAGVDASVTLANDGDVCVGGTPNGRYLDGALDFLRISLGTLADANTTIEELYAWEFDGPFLRDFVGRKAAGKRDAGAIGAAQ